MSLGKKLLSALAVGLVVVIAQRTIGWDLADRIAASGVVERRMDVLVALDWVHIFELAGRGLWVALAGVNLLLLVRWTRPYVNDEVVYVDTEKTTFITVLSSLFTGISAIFLLPGPTLRLLAVAGVIAAFAGSAWRIQRVQRRRRLEHAEYLARKYAEPATPEPDHGTEAKDLAKIIAVRHLPQPQADATTYAAPRSGTQP